MQASITQTLNTNIPIVHLLKQKEDGAENNSIDDNIRCLHREHVLQQVRR